MKPRIASASPRERNAQACAPAFAGGRGLLAPGGVKRREYACEPATPRLKNTSCASPVSDSVRTPTFTLAPVVSAPGVP
jgi:hypothetical protein